MDRDAFLGRVRQSLDGVEPREQPPPYRPPSAPNRAEMTEVLIRELTAVGGICRQAASREEAHDQILELLTVRQAQRVIRGDTPLIRELKLDTELENSSVELTIASADAAREREGLRQAAFEADAGITSVDFGVAETGTLALLAVPGQGRAVSLLPPVHIAVLDSRDIVYELAALFERVRAQGAPPSALTFITGPSRTGDIEQTLTVGVHGPGELHLIVING